jgi:hypothetical protein
VTGTYLPKQFILEIASWISIEFYDKCNNIILKYFVTEHKSMNSNTLHLHDSVVALKIEGGAVKLALNEEDDEIDERCVY